MGRGRPASDDLGVAHLLTLLSATFLFYVSVTRGALVFARVLERVVPKR